MRARRDIAIVLALTIHGAVVLGQGTPVQLDLKARKLSSALPYGEDLTLRGEVPKETKIVIVRVSRHLAATKDAVERDSTIGCEHWIRSRVEKSIPATEFHADMLHNVTLRPGKDYLIHVWLLEPKAGSQELDGCGIAQIPSYTLTDSIEIRARTNYEAKARFNGDIGVLRTYRMGYFGAASNVHFSVVPLNPNEDLANEYLTRKEHFLRRFTFLAGLTLKEFSSKETVKPLTPAGSLLAGVAYRSFLYFPHQRKVRWLFEPMRLGANVVWFRQEGANPLVNEDVSKIDLAVQLGFDVPLQQLLNPVIGLLAGSK